jgi:hypothetical protein
VPVYGIDYASWVIGFFRLGQGYDTLPNFYRLNFQLHKHHNFTIDMLENLAPYEREVYVLLLKEWLEEEYRKQQQKK